MCATTDRPQPVPPTVLVSQIRKIDSITRQLDDPALGLPRVMWFFAALAGTGTHLHYVIRQRLLRRLDRLLSSQGAVDRI